MRYNQTTLNKLERMLDDGDYVVRYERGSFQSGYCILEAKKVVVLNKFLTTEGRINTLIDLTPSLKLTYEHLTEDSQQMYDEVMAKQVIK